MVLESCYQQATVLGPEAEEKLNDCLNIWQEVSGIFFAYWSFKVLCKADIKHTEVCIC